MRSLPPLWRILRSSWAATDVSVGVDLAARVVIAAEGFAGVPIGRVLHAWGGGWLGLTLVILSYSPLGFRSRGSEGRLDRPGDAVGFGVAVGPLCRRG